MSTTTNASVAIPAAVSVAESIAKTTKEKKLTPNQKKALTRFYAWQRSHYYDISEFYGRFSDAKYRAWRHCRELCLSMNGRNLKVVSGNTSIFTAGFEFEDPETGVLMYMHITPTFEAAVEQPAQ